MCERVSTKSDIICNLVLVEPSSIPNLEHYKHFKTIQNCFKYNVLFPCISNFMSELKILF